MNRTFVTVLTILFLLCGCTTSEAKSVDVRDAWARPAAQGANSAVYFVIHSSEKDELIGVSSDIAEAVEMHESIMSGDVMEMHQMKSIPLRADDAVTFAPGGLHVMLIGLKQDLKIGDEIEVTLHLQNHPDIQLQVPVQDTPAFEGDH